MVVDSRGVVRNWRHAQAAPWYGGYLSLVSDQTPAGHLEYLARRGVGVLRCGAGRVDLAEGLRRLHDEHGVRRVRTDGGGLLTGALLAAGLVDELIVMVAPTVCEEPRGRNLGELQNRLPQAAARLELVDAETLEGGVVVLRYSVLQSPRPSCAHW